MSNYGTPPLRLALPPRERLADCVPCRGSGRRNGLTQELSCVGCNGFGKIDGGAGEMGEAIPEHILVPELRKVVDHLRRENRALKARVRDMKQFMPVEAPDVYAGSGRYKGD